MGIKLTILPHQNRCIESLSAVFQDVTLDYATEPSANPIYSIDDINLKRNIYNVQTGQYGSTIPEEYRTSIPQEFGLDVRMETGTGKTYCYTALMYELNKRYGFNKFIIVVPTTPIKEGTSSFITSDYAKEHFTDIYPGKRIELSVLNAQKSRKGRKMFPQAISDFARSTRLEIDKISALLMTSGMLTSTRTMDYEYDQTLLGSYSRPYDVLKATRPIVIIDEPHKFKRGNEAYKCLIERIDPLCVIRFGATFPEISEKGKKDYNNLIFNLGPCEAFNSNLVKGVATQMIMQESLNETRVKVLDIIKSRSKPKFCIVRNEKTGKSYTLFVNDSLSIVSEEFHGVTIQSIGKTEEETIKTGITLSNGQILAKGDQIYAGIYGNTYQELMLEQAIQNHIEQERSNFLRETRIKTLSLFFIDSIESYRGEDGTGGFLRRKFESLLKGALEHEYSQYVNSKNKIECEYSDFLAASLMDLEKTSGGYFAEDNSNSDVEIQKEVDQILRDKQSLLSFKDKNGQWNTRRFIFSKWTLREGWDNPNVFQICKLRSSGSEISKLQEVGRGLRLPVDEFGNRVADEQFYLTYLYDFSESDFANSLIDEINRDSVKQVSIKEILPEVSEKYNMTTAQLMGELMIAGYIDTEGRVLDEFRNKLFDKYPEFNTGLIQNKVVKKNENQKFMVGIRSEKFDEIKELWKRLNEKYYLVMESIPESELFEAILDILKNGVRETTYAVTLTKSLVVKDSQVTVKESSGYQKEIEDGIPYGEFLKRINKNTGLSIAILHKALCEYHKISPVDDNFFNRKTLEKFVEKFQGWFDDTFLKRFSYKALDIGKEETSLTDITGAPKKEIIQGVIGVKRDDTIKVPDNFLYDQVVYDSPKEQENIKNSAIDEVVVFGKIPRKSIQVPLYFGGTTSPDFMYVIKKDSKYEVNLIVETKDVDKETTLRRVEKLKIESAKKFFEALRCNGINVVFKTQLKNDDIVPMIKGLKEEAV